MYALPDARNIQDKALLQPNKATATIHAQAAHEVHPTLQEVVRAVHPAHSLQEEAALPEAPEEAVAAHAPEEEEDDDD